MDRSIVIFLFVNICITRTQKTCQLLYAHTNFKDNNWVSNKHYGKSPRGYSS